MAGTSELIEFRRAFVWLLCGMLLPSVALVAFGVVAVANERAAVERRLAEEYDARLRALGLELLGVELEVGQGQATPSELAGQGRQGHPRLDGDRRRIWVVAQQPGVLVQAHLHPVGARHVGEGVARAHRLHPEPVCRPGLHHLDQILDRAGPGDLDRGAALVPTPVPPRTRGSVGHGEMLSSASRRRPGIRG